MLKPRRMWHQFRMLTISSPMRRVRYLKKKGYLPYVGERVMIMSRKIPLYSELIRTGNNVWIASGVRFITHDVVHYMLNGLRDGTRYMEKYGGIELGSNIFIGTDSILMYDVKIGDRCVIAAGSVVTKDIPSGTVVAGVPAKVIGSFDDLVHKRKAESSGILNDSQLPKHVSGELQKTEITTYWDAFDEQRKA